MRIIPRQCPKRTLQNSAAMMYHLSIESRAVAAQAVRFLRDPQVHLQALVWMIFHNERAAYLERCRRAIAGKL